MTTEAVHPYRPGERVRYNGIICTVASITSDGRLNLCPIVGNWKATVNAAEVSPVGSIAHSFAPPREHLPDDEPARYIDAIDPDTAEVARVETTEAQPPHEVEVPPNVDPETGEYLDRGAPETAPNSLVKLDEARRFLAEARAVDDVKALRDKAEAMRVYAKQAKLGLEAQNYAAEIKLRAERRAGELLLEIPRNDGTKGQLQGRDASGGRVTRPPEADASTLSEIGISKYQSSAWQKIAALDEGTFEAQIENAVGAGEELTTARLLRLAQRGVRQERKREVAQMLPPDIYNVIYADPPWQYSNTGLNGAAEHHYSTMPIDDIYALPTTIGLCIADAAVLFLWVTSPFLVEGLECVHRWGFAYKTHLVWVKTDLEKPGVGWYVRGRHELLLIATRGSFTPLDEHIAPPIGSVLESPIEEHSRKPDAFYAIIERLYPGCNPIELFARRAHEGWAAWGDELG